MESFKTNKNKQSYMKNVIIVGAGAAGLGAAQQLVKHGIKNIAILEAANRIGGRVHTVKFGKTADKIVELGANWIHGGSLINPVYEHFLNHHVSDRNDKIPQWKRFEKSHFLKYGGDVVDPKISKKATGIFFEEDKAIMKLWLKTPSEFNGEQDFLNYMKTRLNQRIDKDFETNQTKDARLVFDAMLNYLRAHVGDDLQKVSALHYGTYEDIPGGDIIVPKGFQNLLETIANELPPDCIHMNHTVSTIEWNSLATQLKSTSSHPIRVKCQNGIEFQGKHVIITISLGCLKKYHQRIIQPELPRFKVEAIENIGFGCTNKIFIEFENEFHAIRAGNMILTWTDDGLLHQENKSSIGWERSIFSFDEVYGNPNILVGWVSGDGARQMENLTDQQVADMCNNVLKHFIGSALIPPIKKITRSKWSSDPLVLGSYSYASNTSGPKEVESLGQPLPSVDQPKLLFCGEATHPNYYSTVHGALLSGIREADRIKLFQSNM